jgi:hypothetical protein
MSTIELKSGTILKVTSVDGNPNACAVITGVEEPFNKRFLSDVIVSGSVMQPTDQTYAFHVKKSSSAQNQSLADNDFTVITFDEAEYNFGNKFNTSTNVNLSYYQAAVTGLYQFETHILIEDTGDYSSNDRMDIRFYYGNAAVASLSDNIPILFIVGQTATTNQFRGLFGTTQLYLNSGDKVVVKIYNKTGQTQNTYNGTGEWVRFTGRLVQRTQ